MEIFASLDVTSAQLGSDEIGSKLAMRCDKCWVMGDVREKTAIREKVNGWRIVCHLDSVDDLGPPIEKLLERISGNEERVASIAEYCNVVVRCAVYSNDVPALFFGDDLLRKLTRIRAGLDVDLYLI